MGSLTTSCRFSITKSTHSCTKTFIYKKSLEIRIEMTFLMSSVGPPLSTGNSDSFYLRYFISHSNIFISQCTLISISSTDVASVRYFSKYFIWVTNRSFSQVKSLFTFLFSSKTCITIISYYFLFEFPPTVTEVEFYDPSPPLYEWELTPFYELGLLVWEIKFEEFPALPPIPIPLIWLAPFYGD